jgi:hypothetical protein
VKGKVVDSDARDATSFWLASQQESALKKNRSATSVRDKAKNILANSEVGASEDHPPHIRNSVLER